MAGKRPTSGTTTSERPAKKRAVAKGQSSAASTSRSSQPSSSKEKARRRPVTAKETIVEESDTESADGEEEDVEFPDLYEGEDENEMEVDEEQAAPPKDPNAARESHKLQKETQKQRQAAKPNADILAEAKRHWSLARQRTLSRAERQRHVALLLEAVRGKVQDLVFKHDASRVVQTIVKCGGQKEREEVALELSGKYKELAQSKYAKFLVTKLLRYCPNQRSSILSEFHGHTVRLLLHREASPIIADAYELYANASEREKMLRDLFGKEVGLFQSAASEGNGQKGLQAVLDAPGVDGERRKRIVAALKENLFTFFNNPDKGAVSHAIVHRALWEYLQEINTEEESAGDKKRTEMFESCQELLAEMVHTKEGSRAVREFLAYGTAKDRKQIIKVLKPHVERMCKDEEAQLVLFTAMDVVDDTKLLDKSIITPIVQHARSFSLPSSSPSDNSKSGTARRTLFYILTPRSLRHFPPSLVSVLSETDAARERTSKKDKDVREKEVRTAGSTELLRMVEDVKRMDEMLRDPGASLVVLEILLYAEGDRKSSIHTLISLLHKPYPTPIPSNGELMHILDIPHASRIIKTLVQGGHYNRASNAVDSATAWPVQAFIRSLLIGDDAVQGEDLVKWASGNGAFVVAELIGKVLEGGDDAEEERKVLKALFGGKDVKKEIESSRPRGLDVLLERIGKL